MQLHWKNYLLVICLIVSGPAIAQIDTLRAHLNKMNTFYDSAGTMAFDVRFVYSSDTVLGNYQHRENEGNFIMDKNRYYYKLDFTECVQSDSFQLVIMEPEKLIMLSPPATMASGGIVPLRNKIDTLLSTDFYGFSYNITKTDSINKILFYTSDSLAEFKSFALLYDPVTYALKQYQVSFYYYPESNVSEIGELIKSNSGLARELMLTVHFMNYRVATVTESLFDLDNYIMADGNEEWKGIGKYSDFTISRTNR